MNESMLIAAVLVLVAALSAWRGAQRAGRWRSLDALGPLLLAGLFWCVLYPPAPRLRVDALTVLTPGATPQQLAQLPRDVAVVRLPGAPGAATLETAPDLATALRRHAPVQDLRVVGTGLAPHDREAVPADMALQFDAAPLQGIVALQAPQQLRSGVRGSLSGRLAGAAVRVELRDPADAVADAAAAGADGRFQLATAARGEGPVLYRLRALDAAGKIVDEAMVPLQVLPGVALQLRVRAGSPDPDLKYLRRWAEDAGMSVAAQIGLSERLSQRMGDAALDPQSLAATDVVIIDERAWLQLTAADKAALRTAVDAGMGLLLRITGPVPAPVAADWRAYGYRVQPDTAAELALDQALGMETQQRWQRAPVQVDAADAQTLLASDDGVPLVRWREQGRGRVGVWLWLDSYRLVLAGDAPRHGSRWASLLGRLARPRETVPAPEVPAQARVDQRTRLCGRLRDQPSLPAEGGEPCRAWWPAQAGWHWLQAGTHAVPFYVRERDADQGLQSAANQQATRALQQAGTAAVVRDAARRGNGVRWPWCLLWLLSAAVLWWRERQHG